MTPSADMLRKLGSGVRPGLSAPASPHAAADAQRFEELLAAAKGGSGTEGIGAGFRSEPVRLSKGSKIELAAEQLRRLGPAVDAAEAQGSHTLLAFIDGKGVLVDVASRTVSGVAKPGQGVVSGVDAVAVIPDAPRLPLSSADLAAADGANAASASAQPSIALPLPSTESIRNADLSKLLAALRPDNTGAFA
ncbi:MAG: hypothetical protein ACKVZJ_09415 [Phycisphaerales bacterium]